MLNKIFSILLIFVLWVSVAGCSSNSFPARTKQDNGISASPFTTGSSTVETSQSVSVPKEIKPHPIETELFRQSAETNSPQIESSLSDSDFVAVKDYIPEISVDLKYATENNFTEQVIYEFQDAYLRYGTVKKLIGVTNDLAKYDFYLKIWDAFRPTAAQYKLWEVYPDPNFVSNPNVKHSSHSRGNTVDITLVDARGKELEMPTGFDDFSTLADRDYSDCSPTAATNAILLQKIMEENGFSGYSKEWWHYSDEVEYPVEECFDPAKISTWYADCDEYINLRTAPNAGAKIITQIPPHAQFTLLGWSGQFALVEYQGFRGYVSKRSIHPSS